MKEIVVDESYAFTLYFLPDVSKGKWNNYKLVRIVSERKNIWRLAWNGERLASSPDSRSFLELEKKYRDSVIRWIKRHCA